MSKLNKEVMAFHGIIISATHMRDIESTMLLHMKSIVFNLLTITAKCNNIFDILVIDG